MKFSTFTFYTVFQSALLMGCREGEVGPPSPTSDSQRQTTSNINEISAVEEVSSDEQTSEDLEKVEGKEVCGGSTCIKTIQRQHNGTQYRIIYSEGFGDDTRALIFGYATKTASAKPDIYDKMMKHLAANQYVIIMPLVSNTGRGEEMFDSFKVLKENFQDLDLSEVGVFGHSQGGGTSIRMSNDNRIKAVVAIQPDCWNHIPLENCVNGMSKPTLYLSGGQDFLVPRCTVYDLFLKHNRLEGNNSSNNYVDLDASDHMSWMGGGPSHDEFTNMTLAWFNKHLKGTSEKPKPISPTQITTVGSSISGVSQNITNLITSTLQKANINDNVAETSCSPSQYDILANIHERVYRGSPAAGADIK